MNELFVEQIQNKYIELKEWALQTNDSTIICEESFYIKTSDFNLEVYLSGKLFGYKLLVINNNGKYIQHDTDNYTDEDALQDVLDIANEVKFIISSLIKNSIKFQCIKKKPTFKLKLHYYFVFKRADGTTQSIYTVY